MNEENNTKNRGGLPELLTSPFSMISNNISFKKIKSNSINVIDFESTLSSKNKPIYNPGPNQKIFKRREFLKQNPEAAHSENKQKDMNNSLYKYLETNTNNNNFNSTHYSNIETNSNKTKETNGASTNHETNRHSFSMIFNLKNHNNSSPRQIKDHSQPYNIEHNNNIAINATIDIKKKITSNSIGNLTIDHIINAKQSIQQGILKPPLQTTKFGNKTENLIKNPLNEKKSIDDRYKKNQILTASLYNDIKQVFDFKKETGKNKDFIPNLKYPCLFFEEKEKEENPSINRKLVEIKLALEKNIKNGNKTEFLQWKMDIMKKYYDRSKNK